VKRMSIAAVLSLTLVFLVTALAGQASAQLGSPAKVSAKSKPKTDKKSPFKFKVTGAIALPSSICQLGGANGTNCIPLSCAPGMTNAKYCGAPAAAQICSGKVRVTFKKGSKTVKKKTVSLKSSCKYSATVTFKNKKGAKGKFKGVKVKVTTRFLGNSIFSPKNAKAFTVKVGKK
jgi:hypothetical protein